MVLHVGWSIGKPVKYNAPLYVRFVNIGVILVELRVIADVVIDFDISFPVASTEKGIIAIF